MSKNLQVKKNLVLIEKLFDYLTDKNKVSKGGYSYVVFSKEDEALNRENEKLIEPLLQEGKKVIKATETGNVNKPWAFINI